MHTTERWFLRLVALLITITSSLAHELPGNQTNDLDLSGLWPQWRGPQRDGHVGGEAWPDTLHPDVLGQTWRVELGPSYSGPIVAADRVFTTQTKNKTYEVVHAFDRKTGIELWQYQWQGAMEVPFFAAKNGSWIRATPAYDGECLYVAGMKDVLVCLDAQTGEPRWTVDFTERHDSGAPSFGFVCSPLIHDDAVYVQAGGGLCKIDRATGDAIWRALADGGGMNGGAFSSPFVADLHGQQQLLVLTRTHMNGVDLQTGQVHWNREVKSFRGMNILTPVAFGDAVFTAPYGGRAQLLTLHPDEDSITVEAKWDNKLQGYMTSPVIVDDYAYFFTRSNRFACVSLTDGEIGWISEPTGDEYWSLVAQDDLILALANTGTLRLILANPDEYDVIDEAKLTDAPTWAHLAVTGGDLYIRELHALTAYRWE